MSTHTAKINFQNLIIALPRAELETLTIDFTQNQSPGANSIEWLRKGLIEADCPRLRLKVGQACGRLMSET